jgi:hypothetical protein
MSRNQRMVLWSALLTAVVATGLLIYHRGPASPEGGKESGQNGSAGFVTAEPKDGNAEKRAKILLKFSSQPPRQSAGSAAYWKDDEITRTAKEVLVPALVKVETKNARTLFSRKFGAQDISAIAISAPTAEDIASISVAMTAALEKVPPARKAEVQGKLQAMYNQYTAFKGGYRVVYATQMENGNVLVTVDELKDLEDVLPAEDGTINHATLGSGTFTSEEAWRTRYGHLFEDSDTKEPK